MVGGRLVAEEQVEFAIKEINEAVGEGPTRISEILE